MFWYAAAGGEFNETLDCIAIVAVRLWSVTRMQSQGEFRFRIDFEWVGWMVVEWHRVEEEAYILDARCRSRSVGIRALGLTVEYGDGGVGWLWGVGRGGWVWRVVLASALCRGHVVWSHIVGDEFR
jgi:hypothetical protein